MAAVEPPHTPPLEYDVEDELQPYSSSPPLQSSTSSQTQEDGIQFPELH